MRDKEIVGLWEAYLQVHQPKEEVEQLDEFLGSGTQKFVDDFTKKVQSGLKGLGFKVNENPRPTIDKENQRNTINQKVPLKNSFDPFDAILEHLVSEGYADTNESALAIMANMSEEWREEILDEANEIMSITSPEGKRKKVNRTYPSARASQNAQNARKLGALQKRQRLNPNAMGPRAARRQATDEVETNTIKSISRLNAAKNIEDTQADGDYENPIDHSKPYGKGKSGYMEVPTDYRARNRRARDR